MIEIFVKDIPQEFKIENSQLNLTMIKELLNALRSHNMLTMNKQRVVFDEKVFKRIWRIYADGLKIFDPNYNRQEDFRKYFDYLIRGVYLGEQLNFFALFCPGYTKYGYKDYLGYTTKWKLKRLKDLNDYLEGCSVRCNIVSCYSDVFLENTNEELEPCWQQQLDFNRNLFHVEGLCYFNENNICNASSLKIFKQKRCVKGFISPKDVEKVNPRTYFSFKKANEKFYKKLGFTNEEMRMRNDRLITMYRMLSDYLNTIDNMVFLPMENMYERENIYSENGTCTMYLILKGEKNAG